MPFYGRKLAPRQLGSGDNGSFGRVANQETIQVVTGGAEVAGSGALPNVNKPWWLIRVALEGGAGAGVFSLNYDGSNHALFPVGKAMHATWGVNWKLPANNIVDGNMTVPTGAGGLDVAPETVELTLATEPDPESPPIQVYRGIANESTQAGANTTKLALTAQNYDVAPSYPVGISAFTSADDAEVFFPSTSGVQGGIMAELDSEAQNIPISAAPVISAQSSIIMSILNEGAAHISYILWVQPAAAGQV